MMASSEELNDENINYDYNEGLLKLNNPKVEEAFNRQRKLKANPEYEKMVNDTFVQIATLFKEIYPNIGIEPPIGREKSEKSLAR